MIQKRQRVLSEHEAGVSVQELAEDFGVKPLTVRQWIADARRERALLLEYVEMLEGQE